MKIAFVVQRYGTEILGGAEYHCRLIAERLAARHQVEVLTTCARDYVTWKNEYAEGTDRLRGVTVRRFPTSHERDIQEFNRFSDWIFNNRHTRQDEMEWLKQQGPWTPGLIEHLERNHQNYDAIIFFTYLYAPTVMGLKVAPWKSLLVPTAHDEPAIRLGIYQETFGAAAGIIWNTQVEREFVHSRFRLRAYVEDVVGCGVDLPEGEAIADPDERELVSTDGREALPPHIEGPANAFRRRHRLHGPFVLYGGRIDPGKGCEELLEYFQSFVADGGDATLALMGTKLMPLPEDPRVRFAGMLPDAERFQALEAATVVVVPSPHESLSLLALEAFAMGTPVLANARSEVLVEHCRRGNAGLYYGGRWEFVEALKLLLQDAGLRAALGRNGKNYVNDHYRWTTVLGKYERLLARVQTSSPAQELRARGEGRPESRGDSPRPDPRDDGRDRGAGRDHGASRDRRRTGERHHRSRAAQARSR